MAKAKGTAVADPKTGEVMDAALLDAMMGDAGKQQDFRQEDLIIPRVTILQDLSPQTKDRRPEYVPGARPGLIFNTVSNAIDQQIVFIPAHFVVRYIAWKPRPDGSLVDQNFDKSLLTDDMKVNVSMWETHVERDGEQVKVEVIETPEWSGLAIGSDGRVMAAALSFPSTKSKAARKINTTIATTEVQVGEKVITPPSFYHQFTLSTALETSGENEWFSWVVNHDGFVKDQRLVDKARDLYDMLHTGEAVVADATSQGG